jgi:hypothetical protein
MINLAKGCRLPRPTSLDKVATAVVPVVPALQPEPINPDDSEMEIDSPSNCSKSLSDRSNVPLVHFNTQSQKLNVNVVRIFGSERLNSNTQGHVTFCQDDRIVEKGKNAFWGISISRCLLTFPKMRFSPNFNLDCYTQ